MEWRDPGSSGLWQPSRIRAFACYSPDVGLVITLAADDSPRGTGDENFQDLILTATYQDRAGDPPTSFPDALYNFTITEDMRRTKR
jgi:hypothetical protein